jgi:hypothetical protein
MDVTEHFDWRFKVSQHDWLGLNDRWALLSQLQDMLFFWLKFRIWSDVLSILNSEEGLQEKLGESLISVFGYVSLIFKLWTKLFRFFLKLINRDLLDKLGEVFVRLFRVVTHGYMSLVWKLEFSLFIHSVEVISILFDTFFGVIGVCFLSFIFKWFNFL